MKDGTKTAIFAVIVTVILSFTFVFAFKESGIIEAYQSREETTSTSGAYAVDYDNITDTPNIEHRVSGVIVTFWYVGPDAFKIRWDFGDYCGDTGQKVTHPYTANGLFLVTIYAELEDNTTLRDYETVIITMPVLGSIDGAGVKVPITASTLFAVGIASLIYVIISRWIKNIPPESFTPKLRAIFGVFMIAFGMLALGWFNPLVGVDVDYGDPTIPESRLDIYMDPFADWLSQAIPAFILIFMLIALYFVVMYIADPPIKDVRS